MSQPPHKHAEDSDIEKILRDKAQELTELMASIAAGEGDIDLKIAAMLEGEPENVRMAIIQKVKETIKEREEQRSRDLKEEREVQKRQVLEQQRMSFRQWLTWIMSEDTIRRLRETFMIQPLLELKVRNLGEELMRKGVFAQLSANNDKRELGNLSANVQRQQDQGKNVDKGRG